ncbi:unnamed protein product [Owenia fusiformis]|uniref:Uncharacterized protein n=1 Tax=Owenia fusiformis TaxID=6347 RepID=A0A8J1XTV4_OWEFU|nr:unnamed protein product [Owenia fusiformis]
MKALLLGLLVVIVTCEEQCNTPTYPDINGKCNCDPTSSQPFTVRCDGQNIGKLPSIPSATHTLYIANDRIEQLNIPGTSKDLQGLFIRKSGINSIAENAFQGMTKLGALGLEDNKLTSVAANTFNGLSNVTKIYLSNNSIDIIEAEAFNLPSLKDLILSGNQIKDLPKNTFGATSQLTSIDVSDNKLTSLADGLGQLTSLETLHLNRNHIASLGASRLLYLISLTTIHAHTNYVNKIGPKAFDGLAQLKTLNLGNNQVLEISKEAFQVCRSTIKEVHLQNNNLFSLHEDTLPWEDLTTLKLDGNPWACECDLTWLMTGNTNMKYGNLTCDAPAELKGTPLDKVDQKALDCPEPEPSPKSGLSKTHLILAIAIPAGVVLLIIIVVVIICCRRKRNAEGTKSVKYSAVYKPTTEQKA